MRRCAVLLAAMICVHHAALPAFAAGVDPGAATPVQREQAQARFLRGKQLFEAHNFEDALKEFRASHEIIASPNTRLYVARSLRELARPVEAYVEFGRVEVEAREHAREDTRYVRAGDSARQEREALKQKVGFVTVQVEHADASTKLFVGSEEIRRGGWSEPIPAVPGATEVRLETDGRAPAAASVTIQAGKTESVSLDVEAGAPTAAAPNAVAPAAEEETTHSLRPFAYVAGGVGVAGLATFGIFALLAKGTHDGLVDRCPDGHCASDPSSDASSGRTQSTIANVGLVVGLLGLGTGAALYLIDAKGGSPDKPAVAARVGLGHVSLEGRF